MILPLAKISILMNVFIGLFIAIAILLVLVILIQKGKGGGVGAMFGGLGASSLLGSKTGDFLTWVTISLVALFLVLAVLMDKYLKPQVRGDLAVPPARSLPLDQPSEQPAAPAPEAPAGETPGAAAETVQEEQGASQGAAEGADTPAAENSEQPTP